VLYFKQFTIRASST